MQQRKGGDGFTAFYFLKQEQGIITQEVTVPCLFLFYSTKLRILFGAICFRILLHFLVLPVQMEPT